MGMRPIIPGISLAQIPGYQQEFLIRHATSTSINVGPGQYEANRKLYTLASPSAHALTSLASAFGRHYVYLDVSMSAPTAPVFYDATTAPVYSVSKNGWYHPTNTDDRVVGDLVSPLGGATINYFDTYLEGDTVVYRGYVSDYASSASISGAMASSQTPTGAWQVPNLQDADAITPENAVEILFQLSNRETAGQDITIAITSKEAGDANFVITDSPFFYQGKELTSGADWLPLGASRKIYVAGAVDDNPDLTAYCGGIKYKR